jgi:hypothetical protein
MSKAVVYEGTVSSDINDDGEPVGEWEGDEEVTDVTLADGVTEIKQQAFMFCKGLTNLSFLEGSAIMTIGNSAFTGSGIVSLLGTEDVRKIGSFAFAHCKDLHTIEGLGCEEMGTWCFAHCTKLQSMKGWPASMTVIPACCVRYCTGMTTVDCDLSHVSSIGASPFGSHPFAGCTSLLPPELAARDADPAAVLAFLKEKYRNERARPTFLFCLKSARSSYYDRTGDPCGASRRIIMEFAGLFPA